MDKISLLPLNNVYTRLKDEILGFTELVSKDSRLIDRVMGLKIALDILEDEAERSGFVLQRNKELKYVDADKLGDLLDALCKCNFTQTIKDDNAMKLIINDEDEDFTGCVYYSCPKCNFFFGHNDNVIKHDYSCPHCGQKVKFE